VDSLINTGLNVISYFGHGSPAAFDYNLNPASFYKSAPKQPLFFALACEVSYIFGFTTAPTLSETWMKDKTAGSIAFIGASTTSYTNFHGPYLRNFYISLSQVNFGKPLGTHFRFAYNRVAAAHPIGSAY